MSKKKKKPVVVDENIADEIEAIEIETADISSDEDESPKEEIIELDPIISRDFINKPKELKNCLDNLSKLITNNIREYDE